MAATSLSMAAMGSVATVIAVGDRSDEFVTAAHRRIDELEALWSRFRSTSEITRLNLGAIAVEDVSAESALLLRRGREGIAASGGRFNPFQLAEVAAAGYRTSQMPSPAPDEPTEFPAGGVDPGGIGKGLAADLVSAMLLGLGADGAMVEIGGDLRVRGRSPQGGPWIIDIEDPRDGSTLTSIELFDGAVATSSRCKRRWRVEGFDRHHIIDPRTGEPAVTAALSATVIAAEAWQAEVLAKAVLIDPFGTRGPNEGVDGPPSGIDLVDGLGAATLVVTDDLVLPSAHWGTFDAALERG